jgi:hypothetical protein
MPILCAGKSTAVNRWDEKAVLYLLRFERVDNLGAYRIPPEIGILIPSDFNSYHRWNRALPKIIASNTPTSECAFAVRTNSNMGVLYGLAKPGCLMGTVQFPGFSQIGKRKCRSTRCSAREEDCIQKKMKRCE